MRPVTPTMLSCRPPLPVSIAAQLTDIKLLKQLQQQQQQQQGASSDADAAAPTAAAAAEQQLRALARLCFCRALGAIWLIPCMDLLVRLKLNLIGRVLGVGVGKCGEVWAYEQVLKGPWAPSVSQVQPLSPTNNFQMSTAMPLLTLPRRAPLVPAREAWQAQSSRRAVHARYPRRSRPRPATSAVAACYRGVPSV